MPSAKRRCASAPERVYALVRCRDGRWLLLNRHYKPFGQRWPRAEWADYQTCPGIRVWLRERDLRELDGANVGYRSGDRMCWLFYDGTNPRLGGTYADDYERRIAMLDVIDDVDEDLPDVALVEVVNVEGWRLDGGVQ